MREHAGRLLDPSQGEVGERLTGYDPEHVWEDPPLEFQQGRVSEIGAER